MSDTHGPHSDAKDYAAVDGPIGTPHDAIYVYDPPLRYWHWINAGCITTLALTGYFIGSPPPSFTGEASGHFLFGYIRFAHFSAGLLLVVAFLARIFWAFYGNFYARQIFTLPAFDKKWFHELLYEFKWYLFLTPWPRKYIGHNPLAHLSMVFLLVLPVVFMIFTGLALYAEGLGVKSSLYPLTRGAFWLFGGSMQLHTWHHCGMWVIVLFVIIHIYTALREEVMSLQSMISVMTSGWRHFRNEIGK